MEANKKLIEKTIEETKEHQAKVFSFMEQVCDKLLQRAATHDDSKHGEGEVEYFAQAKYLKSIPYGSDEYFAEIRSVLSLALEHHYKKMVLLKNYRKKM